jgi:putative hydrolase of the HAD superfamily
MVEWDAYRGAVVPEVLAFVRSVRHGGIPVALATNATDDLDLDLAAFGLAGEFDAVANSSVLGAHKPTREYFEAACALVDTPPERCLLVDDDDRNVRGARAAGLSALRFTGVADLDYVRAALDAGG